ncbi:MAG TPA: S8 family serine peptidase [Bacteroidales bacterium]
MRKLYVLIVIGWLVIYNHNQVKANNVRCVMQTPAVEIGFQTNFIAPDLQIKRLTAVLVKDSILFTLVYSSQKDRLLAFFNPPEGDVIKYIDRTGIKKADTLSTFYIAKNQFQSVVSITMRFSTNEDSEKDRNFIFLDILEPSVKNLLGINKDAKYAASNPQPRRTNITSFKKYQDVRWCNLTAIEDTLTYEKISKLTYNKDSKFGKHTTEAEEIIEQGKNPGLGIRAIHKQGITGKGITIAIIDQNLPGKHPEYKGKIAKYKDVGCKQPENSGSMHGPGVLSLLVGETIGTAPDAKIYFAAAPSWTRDAKYEADALNWVIEENRLLPKGDKIRVVSCSGAPSGPGSPFTKNNSNWDEAVKTAEQEGIIVLDCTKDHGFIGPCYYDRNNPEDVKQCKVGWPDRPVKDSSVFSTTKIFAPCSNRTVAEEYNEGTNSYQYCGKAGLSWSIPYVAGVMAMGWQIKPNISGTDMVRILLKTATTNFQGYKIVDPVKFINELQQIR